jgi:phosphate:Na+ symporter
MKNGFESFQSYVSLADFAMQGFPGLLVFAGVGIIATILMQSSTASIALVITALAIGEVSYENAL